MGKKIKTPMFTIVDDGEKQNSSEILLDEHNPNNQDLTHEQEDDGEDSREDREGK